MDDTLYVATDTIGVDRASEHEVLYVLDDELEHGSLSEGEGPAILVNASGLLDRLDELVFTATSSEATPTSSGSLEATSVSLSRCVAWGPATAARFALACAEHVLGDASDVILPNGSTLASVITDAREYLGDGDDEERVGRLARLGRLSTARRLRRQGELVGDVARGVLAEDTAHDLVATEDPAWSIAAAVADAVLAAVESLRHVALGRWATAREEAAGEVDEDAGDTPVPHIITGLAWGPFAIGGEHQSEYVPASHLARQAAHWARESVGQRQGSGAKQAERSWQADQLQTFLQGE